MKNKAVFIDKDGTLLIDVPYNVDPVKIIFYEGVFGALHALRSRGFLLIMITNQGGLARGFFTEDELLNSLYAVQNMLRNAGVALDDILYCGHHPEGSVKEYAVSCSCRKPQPGLILTALEKWNIEAASSWMIGDILNDIEAGSRAGLRTILIDNAHETEWLSGPHRNPDLRVADFGEAAMSIINLETEAFQTSTHDL